MPLISSHCFPSTRGEDGQQSTLSYQASVDYAVAHPEFNVLFIDATQSGGVSRVIVDGLDDQNARDALRSSAAIASTTQLFLQALAASVNKLLSTHYMLYSLHRNDVDWCRENLDELVKAVHGSHDFLPREKPATQITGNLDETRTQGMRGGKDNDEPPARPGKRRARPNGSSAAVKRPRCLNLHSNNSVQFRIYNMRYRYPLRSRSSPPQPTPPLVSL